MTRRSGLGRGLDALLPGADERLEERSGLREVAVSQVVPNPRQPRRDFDAASLGELTASISELGVLQPLLVRELEDGVFELVAGERRWRAARAAGLDSVPVMVVETDERGSLERALVENLQREDLNPIEEAAAYRALITEQALTQDALATRIGRNRVTITNALRLLELPTSIQKMLVEGKLSAGHGRALLGLQGNPFMERLAQRAVGEGLSVRATEEEVRRYQEMLPSALSTREPAKERPAAVTDVQRALADKLQTRVRVEFGKRKGKITIDFVSLDELERLTRLLLPDE